MDIFNNNDTIIISDQIQENINNIIIDINNIKTYLQNSELVAETNKIVEDNYQNKNNICDQCQSICDNIEPTILQIKNNLLNLQNINKLRNNIRKIMNIISAFSRVLINNNMQQDDKLFNDDGSWNWDNNSEDEEDKLIDNINNINNYFLNLKDNINNLTNNCIKVKRSPQQSLYELNQNRAVTINGLYREYDPKKTNKTLIEDPMVGSGYKAKNNKSLRMQNETFNYLIKSKQYQITADEVFNDVIIDILVDKQTEIQDLTIDRFDSLLDGLEAAIEDINDIYQYLLHLDTYNIINVNVNIECKYDNKYKLLNDLTNYYFNRDVNLVECCENWWTKNFKPSYLQNKYQRMPKPKLSSKDKEKEILVADEIAKTKNVIRKYDDDIINAIIKNVCIIADEVICDVIDKHENDIKEQINADTNFQEFCKGYYIQDDVYDDFKSRVFQQLSDDVFAKLDEELIKNKVSDIINNSDDVYNRLVGAINDILVENLKELNSQFNTILDVQNKYNNIGKDEAHDVTFETLSASGRERINKIMNGLYSAIGIGYYKKYIIPKVEKIKSSDLTAVAAVNYTKRYIDSIVVNGDHSITLNTDQTDTNAVTFDKEGIYTISNFAGI